MTTFHDQLRAFAHKTDDRLNVVIKKIVFDVYFSLNMKSPVGDADYWKSKPPPGYVGGRYRGNWQYGVDKANTVNNSQPDKTGSVTAARISQAIPSKVLGKVHYITNSVSYAEAIETGHSHRQAPHGVVGLTVIEFHPIVKAAAAELT